MIHEFCVSHFFDEPEMSRKEFESFIECYNLPVFVKHNQDGFHRFTLYQGFIIEEKENL